MQQLDDSDLILSLRDARIPSAYHKQGISLANEGKRGETLAEWLNSNDARVEIMSGKGRVIVGETDAVRLIYMVARGFMLKGVGVRCYTLPSLIDSIESGTDMLIEEWNESVSVVCVIGFINSHFRQPFTEGQLYRTEMFLSEQMDNFRPFIIQAASLASPWWSKQFLTRLSNEYVCL